MWNGSLAEVETRDVGATIRGLDAKVMAAEEEEQRRLGRTGDHTAAAAASRSLAQADLTMTR